MKLANFFKFFAIFSLILLALFWVFFLVDKYYKASETDLRTLQSEYVYDYIDPDTGVHYLLYAIGAKGGICVRYNSDGSVMVEDVNNAK